MILSDREIRAAVESGRIGLGPLPPEDDRRWASHAIDLTLDREISVWSLPEGHGVESTFAPASPNFNANEVISRHTTAAVCDGDGFVLHPQRFVLGWTVETLRLPFQSRIGARVEGKSSLARIGLGIHVTAPTIHPGFGTRGLDLTLVGSPLRLEIWNVGVYPIRLQKGMAICQVLFEEVHGTPTNGYSGQYAVQGPGKGG